MRPTTYWSLAAMEAATGAACAVTALTAQDPGWRGLFFYLALSFAVSLTMVVGYGLWERQTSR